MFRRAVDSIVWIAAGLLALALPFTSFPLVARLTGSSMVAPLSLLPLLVLLAAWFLPYLLKQGSLPPQTGLLMGFILVTLISSAAAFFQSFPPFKDQTVFINNLQALVTLAIGVCFYLVIAGWAGSSDRLCFLLRWVNWGGALMLAWTLFQGAIWYRLHTYPDWMWVFQGQVSTSLLLYVQRANGFAYEPSWLAHQLNMLYLPFWLAAAVTGFSAHRFRLWKVHFEHLLLAGGMLALVLSVSRIGLLTFLLMVAYLLLLLNLRLVRRVHSRLLARSGASARWSGTVQRWFVLVSVLVMLGIYAGLGFGAAVGMSRYDPRMALMFDFATWKEKSFFFYANQLVFAERIMFWQAGWNIFNDHPLLGVGLGNAGFFFPEKLSANAWALNEVRMLVYQWNSLPNIKSLWIRILAETGLVGFAFFSGWWYILWKSARYLIPWNDRLFRTIGLAGSFVLIGFVMEGFSLDTFALPYYWVSFGLLSAACGLACRFAGHLPEQ